MDVDPAGIVPVAIEPEYCSQCGADLEPRPFEGRDLPWCPDCEYLYSKGPVPAVQVVVHGDESVLLVEERHTDDALWNFPGGAADPREGPREAAVRELAEEAGVDAAPEDLSLLDVHHTEYPQSDWYVVTYEVERSAVHGPVESSEEVADAAYWAVDEAREATEVTRPSDQDHLDALFGDG